MDQMPDGNYSKASDEFDEVDRQHPYSVWATKAQLMSAYALYQANKYDESIVAADRFIQLHPGHRDVAYAYYLKALDYYVQIADVGRDQKTTAAGVGSAATTWCGASPIRDMRRDARSQDRPGARPSRRQGDGDRPLVREPGHLSRRDQPLQGAWSTSTRPPPMCPRRWSG